MATISSPGLGSGLDVNGIVSQLVALESKPIAQLQTQATTIQAKLSAFGLLQSYAANVRDSGDPISTRLDGRSVATGAASAGRDSASRR